ncbi:MAG TPA: hypothetical protein VGO50_16145 [Pyrinomonadaceae bacterium]|jgi:hypothetical protein|nr:hypothetical protein [Pyrinomonadaceae bacterium]
MELCCIGVVALFAICCGMLGLATAANMSATEIEYTAPAEGKLPGT